MFITLGVESLRLLGNERISMEGTWFIQNRHESLYMQVDDDDEPNYANDGGIAEVITLI